MIETYSAGSYWLDRPEPAEACARRAERFFYLLGRCDPAWSCWYESAGSFEEARKRVFTTDAENFQKLFAQEEHRIGDGFSFHLWTGDSLEETSGVDGNCGHSSLHLPSTCVLRPYDEGLIGERVLTAPVMTEVLRAMALAWDPEWGVATSEAHRHRAVKGFPYAGTFVGWVMYFSRLRGTVPPLHSRALHRVQPGARRAGRSRPRVAGPGRAAAAVAALVGRVTGNELSKTRAFELRDRRQARWARWTWAANIDIEENTLGNDAVGSCIRSVIRTWRFPFKPDDEVPVAYPFVFSPAG